MLLALCIVVVLLSGLLSVAALWKHRQLNPVLYFAAFSTFFSITSLGLLDLNRNDDTAHALLIILFNFCILVYCLFFFDYARAEEVSKRLSRIQPAPARLPPLLALLSLSIAISFIYYKFLVGYNLAFFSIFGGIDDFTSMRLAAYSGERYTGAGVINQFKNTILPITFFTLVVEMRRRYGAKVGILAGIALMPVFFWSIAGAGQRIYLFLSIVGLFIYLYALGKVKIIHLASVFAVFLVVFTFQSYALGRTEEVSINAAVGQVIERFSGANQQGTVEGFRYVSRLDVQLGSEWAAGLFGLVPGVKGSDLAHRVHEYMYGSTRGTAPVALWVSIYHNFGFIGVPIVLLLLLKVVDSARALLAKQHTKFHLMSYSFLALYLGLLPMSDPFQAINNGIPGIFFALLVYSLRIRRGSFVLSLTK